MIERFNIDMIAGAIASQVMTGTPDAKLAHRFFRKGRRDGRKQLDPDPIREIVVRACTVAMSRVKETQLRTEASLLKQAASLEQGIADGLQRSQKLGTQGQSESAQSGDSERADDADGAQAILGNAMVLLEQRRSAAAAEAKRAEQQEELDSIAADARTARSQLEEIRAELGRAADTCNQQLETCQEIGALLWARYVSGFEYGQRRGLFRTVDDPRDLELSIDIPMTRFTGAGGSSSAGEGTEPNGHGDQDDPLPADTESHQVVEDSNQVDGVDEVADETELA